MLAPPSKKIQQSRPVVCRASFWVRAPSGGIFRSMIPNGRAVTSKTQLGIVADPFGSKVTEVTPPEDGIVIGQSTQALVDEGDGLFHIAVTRDPDAAERTFLRMENRLREADEEVYHDDIHVTSSEPSASG